ncbi:MAG: sensor histidine kinase [Chthoniobacterales bacterium]
MPQAEPKEPNIPWPAMTRFVSQLNHDLRNHLNAIELQCAVLKDLVEEPEAGNEIQRLRELTGQLEADLQKLCDLLAKIRLTTMTYQAREFVEDLRAKLEREQTEEAAAIEWKGSLGAEAFEIDPQLLLQAFAELFGNAFTHGRSEGTIVFEARKAGDAIEFSLSEPKAGFDIATENWGARPFERIRHGHYGLGLFRARSIFEAHHGTFRAEFDPAASLLVTTINLPRLVL